MRQILSMLALGLLVIGCAPKQEKIISCLLLRGQDFFVYLRTYGVAGSRIVHRSDLPKSNQSIGEESKRNYA